MNREKIKTFLIISFFTCIVPTVGIWSIHEMITLEVDKKSSEIIIIPIVIENNDSLTIENLYCQLVEDSVQFPDIIMRQALHETGNFKSYSCRIRHNLFGFSRKDTLMWFKSWKDCVTYKKKWQKKMYKGGNYYKFLKQIGYAEDSLYVEKLKKIKIKRRKK